MAYVTEDRAVRNYRDGYGNTARVDVRPYGVLLMMRVDGYATVHHLSTVAGAFQAMRTLSGGTKWTEV